MNTALERDTSSPSLAALIGISASVISSDEFPTGDRAKLRRMTPGEPPPVAFYRFAFRHLSDGWERFQQEWMTILAGMSIMAPSVHNRHEAAGQVLAEAGYSEKRLERLLAAEGEMLETLVLRAARFLSAKGQAIDWTQLGQLLLSKDTDQARAIRMRIARDYYRALRETS